MIKKRLVDLLADSKKYIGQNILCQWIALLANIAAIISLAVLLEASFDQTLNSTVIGSCLGVVAASILIRFRCNKLAARASFHASREVKQVLRAKIFEKLLTLGASYKEQVSSSEVVQVSVEGVEQLEIYFGKYLPQLFYSLLAPITLFGILSFVNLKTSLILLVCVPLIPISIVAIQRFAKRLLSKYWGIYTGLGDSFLESLQGLTTLKIYQADEKKAKEIDEESERFRKVTMRVLVMQLNSVSVMDLVAYGGAAIGMAIAVLEYQQGNIGLAGVLMIVLLASEFFIPLRLLGSFFHIAMNGMAASDKIFRILDLPEPEAGERILSGDAFDLELDRVRFSYEENQEILNGVSMKLTRGSFVSLVGASGCGKSTITSLLLGKNRGYQGHIKINGMELSEICEQSLMEHITLVSHNSYLFRGTVEENLRMGRPKATVPEMEEALRKVNLYHFLAAQGGLGARLTEKAGNLSGGQCQRLALARALLHDSSIYIFDEATSNIDMESEALIMNVIHELARTKTVLLISHRLVNGLKSDCIYVLKDGQIQESGKHEELISVRGIYAGLYEGQQKLEQYQGSSHTQTSGLQFKKKKEGESYAS